MNGIWEQMGKELKEGNGTGIGSRTIRFISIYGIAYVDYFIIIILGVLKKVSSHNKNNQHFLHRVSISVSHC